MSCLSSVVVVFNHRRGGAGRVGRGERLVCPAHVAGGGLERRAAGRREGLHDGQRRAARAGRGGYRRRRRRHHPPPAGGAARAGRRAGGDGLRLHRPDHRGGGRVTELVARPLRNLYWPELAGFIQPLSGEYAARRELLVQLPFPTGYGVEVGILVDALRLVGLDALAQVDLDRRKHRNQEIGKLGRMASEIFQVALLRLEREGRIKLDTETCTDLIQYERTEDGYRVHRSEIAPIERPPMETVPDYARSHLRH